MKKTKIKVTIKSDVYSLKETLELINEIRKENPHIEFDIEVQC